MKALRRHLTKDQFHLIDIPKDFAEEVEIIILAVNTSEDNLGLTEDEEFYAANYNQLIEEDESEDQIWSKYL